MNRFKRFVKIERESMHEIKLKKPDDKFLEKSVEAGKTQLKEQLELQIRLKAENLELKARAKTDTKILIKLIRIRNEKVMKLKERLKTEIDKNQQYIMDIHRLEKERERTYRMSDER
eukprot:521129_1